jgi:hypothetical protein
MCVPSIRKRRFTHHRDISGSRASRTDSIVEPERHKRSGKRGIMKTIAGKLSNLSWSSNKISLKCGEDNKSCQTGPKAVKGKKERKKFYASTISFTSL